MSYKPAQVQITSEFWKNLQQLVREVVLPYQWKVINDEVEIKLPSDPAGNTFAINRSGAILNLRIAAGEAEGVFNGFPFQDSDVYKWLEAAAYVLADHEDEELRAHCDEVVALIGRAQMDDGYLDTYFQINDISRRFARLEQSHELYLMGHYIEAGIAYWEAVGNKEALDIACRMADCIDESFGPQEGKIHGGDGHPEIEIALARLFEVTGEKRYLNLAHWFIVNRGVDPDFYKRQNEADGIGRDLFESMHNLPLSYLQADKPYLEQTEVNGHAVRALYLLSAAAHVARLTGDEDLEKTVRVLWNDVTRRRMYVTGQVGSTQSGESFTYDYDLPNDTDYGETCASVALSFVSQRLLETEARGEFGDVLELELFNGVIAGMSLDGKHFFYVNPLEVDPEACEKNPGKRHVLAERAEWFGCACCPANLARLVSSVGRYIYAELDGGKTVLIDQFIGSKATFASGVEIEQRTRYPWHGSVAISAKNGSQDDVRLGIRVPIWAGRYSLTVDGVEVAPELENGFAYLELPAGASVEAVLQLPCDPQFVRASSLVAEDAGKVAVRRGPVIYCMEGADNEGDLWNYLVHTSGIDSLYRPDFLGGVSVVRARGEKASEESDVDPLYRPMGGLRWKETCIDFIPYYAWGNRGANQMRVWVRSSDPHLS